jgi:ribonuclease HII
MKLPNKNIESKYIKSGYGQIIGVDEVGTGCLAGPVVVCAAYFDKRFYLEKSKNLKNVNDSKLLSSKSRDEIARELMKNKYFKYKISLCQPKTIDRLNIHKASKLAMKRAVEAITTRTSAMVLVDGIHKIQDLKIEQKTIIKGDRKIFIIACASIMAKVYRDKLMAKYSKKYPEYGFEIHKGYGTKHHYARLAFLGPSEIHRRSFRLD